MQALAVQTNGNRGHFADQFVSVFLETKVAKAGESDEPMLEVTVDRVFCAPFTEVKKHYSGRNVEVTLEAVERDREKWKAAGHGTVAVFLEAPAIRLVDVFVMKV